VDRTPLAALGLGALLGCAMLGCGDSETPVPAQQPEVDAGPELPPRVCKAPAAPSGAWFVDATAQLELAATPDLEPSGNCIVGADLDGDDYADLVVLRGESDRGLVGDPPKRARFLLMNRPVFENDTARRYEDVPDLGGMLQTREGSLDRGMSNAWLGDLDNDGDVDVVACPSDFTAKTEFVDPCVAFLNDGKASFSLAPQSDIDATGYPAHSGALFDYDRDGILDFFVGGMGNWPYTGPGKKWNFGHKVFKGRGDGTFQDVSAAVGMPTVDGKAADGTSFRRTMGSTHCDLDGDGDQDVVTASYGREENQAWRNDGGIFVEVGHALGLDHDDREDFSDDESYRCYCDATQSCDPMPPPPQLVCNQFGTPYLRGWYPGITDQPYMLGGNNMGVTCADVDDDADMDVVFATIVHGDVGSASDPTELVLNPGDGGKFTRPGNEATGLTRPDMNGLFWNHGDHMVTFADVDLDGRKDLLVASIVYPDSRPWLWRQQEDGTFVEIAESAGLFPSERPDVLGASFLDVDHDGDLDFFTADYEGASRGVRAYQNEIGAASNFVRVALVGKGTGFSNRSGIGARVSVTAGGRTQTQEVRGGQGLSNVQNDLVLTFGLGAACDVDRIEVRWPDAVGTIATWEAVRANYLVVLTEGEPEPIYR
jgi:enediyne biosynthesis protein E4